MTTENDSVEPDRPSDAETAPPRETAQLQEIAAALVADAPTPPDLFGSEFAAPVDISQPNTAPLFEHRRSKAGPFALAAAAALILVSGLLVFFNTGSDQDGIATPTIASELNDAAEPDAVLSLIHI